MTEEQILQLWLKGYDKYKVAKIYQITYNNTIKIIRLDLRNRNSGKLLTNYEALAVVERIIYKRTIKNIVFFSNNMYTISIKNKEKNI